MVVYLSCDYFNSKHFTLVFITFSISLIPRMLLFDQKNSKSSNVVKYVFFFSYI